MRKAITILKRECKVKATVPEDQEQTLARRKYTEGSYEKLNTYFKEANWEAEIQKLRRQQYL